MMTEMKEVKKDEVELIEVSQKGAVHCVDGRLGDQSEEVMSGPKLQGGVLGVMALGLNRGDESAVKAAIKMIRAAGFMPSVHGDDHHGEAGCGFGRLWREGKLNNLPELQVSLERVKEIVLSEGGIYVQLVGTHKERAVKVNMVENMTLIPDGSSFILDAWIAKKLGVTEERLLENAIEVVKKLNGPKLFEIIR